MRRKVHLRKVLRKPVAASLMSTQVLQLGNFGAIALEPGFLTSNQKEAIRRLLARRLRPLSGRYWVSITCAVPLTKKSRGARMGKGRGGYFRDAFAVRSGSIVCEFAGVNPRIAREI
jgi:large subunit ribosomal protein L16